MMRTITNISLWFVENPLRLRMLILLIVLTLFVTGTIFPGVAAFADGGTGGTHSNP